ncbi:MAG: FprA family A-type flavoprotein [Sporomusaceae bacterium]|nr:FprA family A-type flavoprotein [Sporomusaceae bacterium]
MNKVQLASGVYYVGAIDWNLRDFHGYTTPRGVTYNSYLIVDEKICLIDNVKEYMSDELIARISEIVDIADIDYVVTNHVEPDHSGSLPRIMELAPKAKVVLTAQGRPEVIKHYGKEYDFMIVKQGDTLDLGKNKLHFMPLPMLHWPDSMACYLDGEKILFSNDAFGQHVCSSKLFDDENDLTVALKEAAKYYANILMPYTRLIPKAAKAVKELDLKMIAPSHGLVWRSHVEDILTKYEQWGTGHKENKVIIVYDTMWGATDKMAKYVLEGIASTGLQVKLYKTSVADRSDIMLDLLDAKGLVVGSSTLNNSVIPLVGAFLVYLKGLNPFGKRLAGSFGTYGWNGGAQGDINEFLGKTNFDRFNEGLFVKWKADQAELDQCFEYGVAFGKKILEEY